MLGGTEVNTWKTPQITTVLSVLAFCVSSASLAISKLSYDLSIAKDEREIREKQPAIDVQLVPAGAASANVTISIINRRDTNVAPFDFLAFGFLDLPSSSFCLLLRDRNLTLSSR